MTTQGDVTQGGLLAAAAHGRCQPGEAVVGNSPLGTQSALAQLFHNLWLKLLASMADSLRDHSFIYF